MSIFDNKPSRDKKKPPLVARPKLEPVVKHHICTPFCAAHRKKKPK